MAFGSLNVKRTNRAFWRLKIQPAKSTFRCGPNIRLEVIVGDHLAVGQRALRVLNHSLSFKHPFVQVIERWKNHRLLICLFDLQFLDLKVVLGKLALDLRLFANEKDFLSVASDSDFLSGIFYSLLNVKFVYLQKARKSPLLGTLQVQAFVQLDFVEQVVDILGRKVELIAVPLAVHAVLIVVQLVPALHMERYR